MKYTSQWAGFELTTLVVICTDYIGIIQLPYDHDHDGRDTRRYISFPRAFLYFGKITSLFINISYLVIGVFRHFQ
jgi:hypothetical protein